MSRSAHGPALTTLAQVWSSLLHSTHTTFSSPVSQGLDTGPGTQEKLKKCLLGAGRAGSLVLSERAKNQLPNKGLSE